MKLFLDEVVVGEIVNCFGRNVFSDESVFWMKVVWDEFFFCC